THRNHGTHRHHGARLGPAEEGHDLLGHDVDGTVVDDGLGSPAKVIWLDSAGGRGQTGGMIARIWRGWAPTATADDYQRHYETEVGEHLGAVSGFHGARLLRRE